MHPLATSATLGHVFTQILYTGNAQSLGIKQTGTAADKWAELPITKCPKMTECSVGHDGTHALLVSENGAVFFVGAARRGEDGDVGKPTLLGLCA